MPVNPDNRKVGRPATGAQVQVQSLTRSLMLLEKVSENVQGMPLSELSASLDLAPSTAHRLLNALLNLGYLDFDETRNLWSVGLKAFTIGNAYLKKRDVVVQSRPFMRDLMMEVGETCNLAILEGRSVVFLSQVECQETMRMVAELGSRGPLHASGVGKAILSAMEPKEQSQIVSEISMDRLTAKTITSRKALLSELAAVRKQGYAVDDEEQKVGLRCVAAPVFDEFGDPVAALSVSGPTVRLSNDRLSEVAKLVYQTAMRVTNGIGGSWKTSP